MVQIERGVHLAHDAVLTAVLYARRFVAIVTAAAEDVAEELGDMVWDYRHMASAEPRSPQANEPARRAEVIGTPPHLS